MLNKPIKPKKLTIADIYTLDIETDARGDLIDIGFYNGARISYFQSWEKFIKSLDQITESALVYAHNGGGFDYVNMLCYLFTRGVKFEAMLKSGKIFCLWLIDKPHIKFVDSFNILPTSLDAVTKSFAEVEKLEIDKSNYSDMRGFKERERELYYAYLQRDCVSLYQAIIKMRALVNEIYQLGNIPLSIGGISMRLFSRAFLPEKIVTPSKAEKDFTFNAYVGGRCEYLGFGDHDKDGFYNGVNGYDFNSHYPAQMLGAEFPIRRGVYTDSFIRDNAGAIASGVYIAKFEQTAGRIPLLQNCEREYSFDGLGTFTHLELNEIERTGGKVVCGYGFYYAETAPIFDEFVNYFFEKRLEAQKLSDSARNTFYKLVLNNLYGKFGQRDTVESLQVLTRDQVTESMRAGAEVTEFYRIDEGAAFYDVKSEKKCYTAFPAIACMITASARIKLNQVLESCKNPIYCDTDSIHCQDQISGDILGDGLGKLKTEFLGAYARYGGKKSYEIVGEKNCQKGIPKASVNNDFFNELFSVGFVNATFKRPLLLKSAIRKIDSQSPSEFAPFSRVVTRDLSLKEKLKKDARTSENA